MRSSLKLAVVAGGVGFAIAGFAIISCSGFSSADAVPAANGDSGMTQAPGDATENADTATLSDASASEDVAPIGDAGAKFPGDATVLNGHAYLLVCSDTVAWSTASLAATNMGGHLVTITSEAERLQVQSLMSLSSCAVDFGAWIGLQQNPGTKAEPSGGWEWVTGEPMSVTFWTPGEPNNAGPEDVAASYPNGTWQDLPDDGRSWVNAYVVEFEP